MRIAVIGAGAHSSRYHGPALRQWMPEKTGRSAEGPGREGRNGNISRGRLS